MQSPQFKGSAFVFIERSEGDSNPRDPFGAYTLSRRASSATRASLHLLPQKRCKGTDIYWNSGCVLT